MPTFPERYAGSYIFLAFSFKYQVLAHRVSLDHILVETVYGVGSKELVPVNFCFLQFLVLVMFHFLHSDVIDSKLRRYKHVFSLFLDICGYTFDYCFPLLEFNTRMWLRGEVLRILYCILVRR